MDNFNGLLDSKWGSEKWILEGWEQINDAEKQHIAQRMEALFQNGLPFEIQHDKILYLHAFSLLAQLEVLAIQVPLKFKDKMASQENKNRMHQQLLDEIFHGLVFTKITYMLCDPYVMPPEYNKDLEVLCDFIRNEECPKIAVILLNLVAEGWIEETFKSFAIHNIAPKVFDLILMDENRHVCEADIYKDIGMPDMAVMKKKLALMENLLISNFFLHHKYISALSALLGVQGAAQLTQSIHNKHEHQLKKINLQPGENWLQLIGLMHRFLPRIAEYAQSNHEVPMSPIRKVFMSQWDTPSAATMVAQFNLDVSCIDIFNKKYPPETLTTLTLQAVSYCLNEKDKYRFYLNYKKLYQSKETYVGVIVKLPDCQDHMGTIAFANCHEMSAMELAERIRSIVPMMAYCYKRREELEKKHPHLKPYDEKVLLDYAYTAYGLPFPGTSMVTVSNIGFWGYTDAKSPLLENEAMKIVMLAVERKQVWNKESNSFEIRDHMPVSISADHRVFDGNQPIPQLMNHYFQQAYTHLQQELKKPALFNKFRTQTALMHTAKTLKNSAPEIEYKVLNALQTVWPDFLNPEELIQAMTEHQFFVDEVQHTDS